MAPQLSELIALLENLPESEQAEVTSQMISDLKWRRSLSDPPSDVFFERMLAEIAQERAEGRLTDLDTPARRPA